jgi:hypothetical protein
MQQQQADRNGRSEGGVIVLGRRGGIRGRETGSGARAGALSSHKTDGGCSIEEEELIIAFFAATQNRCYTHSDGPADSQRRGATRSGRVGTSMVRDLINPSGFGASPKLPCL